MGFISINKRFTVSGEELAAVVVEVSCTAPAGAFARGSVKGVELAVVIAPADAHAMPVPWDLGYRDSVSHDSISGSGWTCHRIGKIAILNIVKSCSISDDWGYSAIGSLPEGWKPNKQSVCPTSLQQSGNNDVVAGVQTNGEIFCQGKGTSWRNGWLFALVVYVIA